MTEGAILCAQGRPPHTHAKDSLARRWWGQTAALVPVYVAGCLTGHAEILRLLLTSLVSAIAFEFLAGKFFHVRESLQKGETLLTAALFSLLLPAQCPSEVVIFGVFIAVFLGREIFGGIGAYPFHPVLLASVFLRICFPRLMAEPMLLAGESNVWVLAGSGLGGMMILKQRQGYWQTPVLFMAVCFICEAFFGGKDMPYAFFSGVLWIAFFFFADPVILPLTRRGTFLFVLGAAFLSSRLDPSGFSIRSAGYAILGMNLLTPWLDVGLKPVPYKTERRIKATYSR